MKIKINSLFKDNKYIGLGRSFFKNNKHIQSLILFFKNNKQIKKVNYFLTHNKYAKMTTSYFSTFVLGLFSTLFLFFIMSILISRGDDLNKTTSDSYFINFLMNVSLDDLQTRSRRIPKKPKEPKAPPEAPKIKVKAEIPQTPKLVAQNIPKLSLIKDFTSDLSGAAVGGVGSGDSEVTPIVRIEPLYPRKAALRGVEGFVILSFDITPLGTVSGVKILQSSPPQIFNQSAKQALLRWKYKPKTIRGKPVKQKGLKVKLQFKFDKK